MRAGNRPLFLFIRRYFMKELLEKINIQQLTTITFLGLALIISIYNGNENIAMAVGGGLVGYLGGVATGENKG